MKFAIAVFQRQIHIPNLHLTVLAGLSASLLKSHSG